MRLTQLTDLPLTRHTEPVDSGQFGQSRNIQYSPADHVRPASRTLLWHSGHIGDQWRRAAATQNTPSPPCSGTHNAENYHMAQCYNWL